VEAQIFERLKEMKELLQVVSVGSHLMIKKKPKFDPEEDMFDLRANSKRGSQFRGVSRNGKKWQVSAILRRSPIIYNYLITNRLLVGDDYGKV
jgi:hypothetical protein